MNPYIEQKLVQISRSFFDKPVGEQKHYSFLIRRNKVICMGFNNKSRSHPINLKYKFPYDKIHSEIECISSFPYDLKELKKHILVNVRISRNNNVIISKPCFQCEQVLRKLNIKRIYYTDNDGVFRELIF